MMRVEEFPFNNLAHSHRQQSPVGCRTSKGIRIQSQYRIQERSVRETKERVDDVR